MSATTRINRKTYSTPRKSPAGRMVHQSTNYAWMPDNPLDPMGPKSFRKVGKGATYRRPA